MTKKDNTTWVLARLMQELAIPITHQSISDELLIHPNYPSLLAYSEVLNNWNVPNLAYELTIDELITANLETPFIAYFANKQFVVVSNIDKNGVVVSDTKNNKRVLSIADFATIYGGAVLIVGKELQSGEQDYLKNRKKEITGALRLPVIIASSAILLFGFLFLYSSYFSTFNFQIALLTAFKAIGFATTVMLLIQSIDANNPFIKKLCGGDSNKDCNAILSSKAAKIHDDLSWSEVGFFYFAGTLLVLLFHSENTAIMQMLAIVNIVGLPYSFYSIYYQWKIAKQWCVFCCTVQAVLWLEFFSFMPSFVNGLQASSLGEYCSVLMVMIIPVLAWMFIKPYLIKAEQIYPLKQQLQRFKYNKELFDYALKERPKFSTPNEKISIVLGNVEAGTVITMASNLFCRPCANAHSKLDEWLGSNPDIQVRVIFTGKNEAKDIQLRVINHLMALNELTDKSIVKEALREWYLYEPSNYEEWSKRYPVVIEDYDHIIDSQVSWCKMADIKFTPTILINGQQLPSLYNITDLKYMLS